VRQHERRLAAVEHDPPGGDLDIDQRPVLATVQPGVGERRARPGAAQVLEQRGHVLGRPDVGYAHGQELVARVAVVAHRGLVDGEEGERPRVVDPHGERVLLEEHPVALLGARGLDRGRGAPGELAGQLGVVEPERARGQERHRADCEIAADQRHAQGRRHAELAQPLVADVADDLRLARAEHDRRAVRVRGAHGEVRGHRGHAAQLAARLEDVDGAAVGEAGDHELGEALERLLVVRRGAQDLARAREQAHPSEGALARLVDPAHLPPPWFRRAQRTPAPTRRQPVPSRG
jgi:hypothetical protein